MSFAENCKTKILDFYRPITGMPSVAGQLGIEIELEGNTEVGCPTVKGWTLHEDNSLRGRGGIGRGGIEYVTRGAINLPDVHGAVQSLSTAVAKAGITPREDSPRTSTHVHINVQDLSLVDTFGFITVFAAVEPLFLHLCGPRRDGNSFCTPSYDTGDLPDFFHEVFKSIETYRPGDEPQLHQRGKYASLGTFRLHDLGTLEARCFPYSLDPAMIHNWCSWLVNIKELVKAQDDKSFRSLIKLGIHDPMVLARSVFHPAEATVSHYLASELIQFGSREAYELTRLLKFFLNKKPDEKKKRKSPASFLEEAIARAGQPEQEHWIDWNAPPQPVPMPRAGFTPRRRDA